jgi:hypothetical protein
MTLVTVVRTLGWATIHRMIAAVFHPRKIIRHATAGIFLTACGISAAQTPSYSPVVITPPIVDAIDENFVSVFSGKAQFTIPALKLGDVSYTPYSYNGQHFTQGGIIDHNYGRIALCQPVYAGQGSYGGRFECSVGGNTPGLQAIYGEQRATFTLSNGQYTAAAQDGSTFVDGGNTCTWTKRDGTQIVFVGYHVSGNPLCLSNNISQIIYPDGRIATYYYYGAFSTTASSPILSIATNSGYLLKYNYSGTPTWGGETSVVAINRAFQACDPAATTCTLSGTWPTATLSWQNKMMSTSDNFPSLGAGYDPFRHYIFTIEDQAHKKHIFELDSYFRVISYQPPEATSAVYFYTLCSLLNGGVALRNCFGYATWPHNAQVFEEQPLLFDLVESTTRNGQTWSYDSNFAPGGGPQGFSTWWHAVANPLGRTMTATGNATAGMEIFYGPVDHVEHYDGSVVELEHSVRNGLGARQTPLGIRLIYGYDSRGNLQQLTRNPIPNSGLGAIVQSAAYPATCTNIRTCNKPSSATDANGNTADFTYDAAHGGILTVTAPAVNGIRPQTRYTYVQRNAWYLESSGVMTRDTHPIWLLASESYCRTSAASGSGCGVANDEVVTSYEYGPDSGPNNLISRGKAVTADGQTLRTCHGHDKQGNKIWETSPNANRSSCPDY